MEEKTNVCRVLDKAKADYKFHSFFARTAVSGTEVAEILEEKLNPQGVYVVIEAEHMCMTMRGIKKPGAKTITTVAKGVFETDEVKRSEILSFIQMS